MSDTAATDYGDYLDLERLLSAQHPRSSPEHPDELLFIVQHQTTELWFTLVLHELTAVRDLLAADEVRRARKGLARVKHIFRTLTEQWSVLATLTPSEYAQFRGALGTASGLQSHQYRAIEMVLGAKDGRVLRRYDADSVAHAQLSAALAAPSVYDAFLGHLARQGHPVPADVLARDVREAWTEVPELVDVLAAVYADPEAHWSAYAVAEDLVDLEDAIQVWRFRHLRTVQRVIGFKTGTGGTTGVSYLQRALDATFFPELFTVRSRIGA
ncbi:MAG: tryptophan 2,3-dioxygenase family protein [Aeromicrobium erythreum]